MVHDEIERVNDALRGSAAWVARQRWFGEKTRAIIAVEPMWDWLVTAHGLTFALSTVALRFADGGASRYFLPVAFTGEGAAPPDQAVVNALPDGRRIVDALHLGPVQRWFVEQLVAGARFTGPVIAWQWEHIGDDVSVLRRAAELPARVLTGEQSNTSLLYGDALILKVFRRLESGINPDVEIGAYLTTHFPSVPVPTTYGDGNAAIRDAAYTIVAAQEFVPNEGDCWRWLLRVFGNGDPAGIDEAARIIALLGRRTGELHLALGASTDVDAFAPQPIDRAYCDQWRAALRHEIDLTAHLLRQAGHLPADADLTHRLGARLDDVQALEGTQATRVHGDYHLGQVLRTADGDVSILDFEGEPSRPIADRRRRYSPLKDVAGMTRSLDYARATIRRLPGLPLGGAAAVDAWFGQAHTAFVSAWRAATADARGRLAPADDDAFRRTLEMFELEKALYETRYELNNRPDWIDIPFDALRGIAADGA